jgi:hypothetical protein
LDGPLIDKSKGTSSLVREKIAWKKTLKHKEVDHKRNKETLEMKHNDHNLNHNETETLEMKRNNLKHNKTKTLEMKHNDHNLNHNETETLKMKEMRKWELRREEDTSKSWRFYEEEGEHSRGHLVMHFLWLLTLQSLHSKPCKTRPSKYCWHQSHLVGDMYCLR